MIKQLFFDRLAPTTHTQQRCFQRELSFLMTKFVMYRRPKKYQLLYRDSDSVEHRHDHHFLDSTTRDLLRLSKPILPVPMQSRQIHHREKYQRPVDGVTAIRRKDHDAVLAIAAHCGPLTGTRSDPHPRDGDHCYYYYIVGGRAVKMLTPTTTTKDVPRLLGVESNLVPRVVRLLLRVQE